MEGDEVDYAREATDFPGIEMILRIDTEVTKAGAPVRREARHMVTSLGSDDLREAIAAFKERRTPTYAGR